MTNYTGFARINIGGKERPFYYGLAAAEIYCQREGVEFYEFQEAINKAFGEQPNPIYAAKIATACLLAGYEYAEEQTDFKPERVKFWIQEFTGDTWKQVMAVITGAAQDPNVSAPVQAEQAM